MILSLLFSCLSEQNSLPEPAANGGSNVPVAPGTSLFLKECSQSTNKNSTLTAIFDRTGSTDCPTVFKHLSTTKTLDLSNHPTPFSDISILAEFTQIEELYLNDSRISDLNPLAGWTALRKLHIEHCAVRDLKPLAQLTALEDLLLDYTAVDDLSAIAQLTSLKRIGLRNTAIRSLDPLAGMKNLNTLEASGTRVSSLEPLSSLNQLEVVSIRQTTVSNLQPLSNHRSLFFLDARDTNITTLLPLKELTGVKVLDVGNTNIDSLEPIENIPSLMELNVQGLNIEPTSCLHFTDVIQGCSNKTTDRLMALCSHPDDFAFATQVSLHSLQKDLNVSEDDCQQLKVTTSTRSEFTSSNPYPDPRIFTFFPALKTLEIPVEDIHYKYCTNAPKILDNICDQKKSLMHEQASKHRTAFIANCTAPTQATKATFDALKTTLKQSSCDRLWDSVSMTEKLSLQRVGITNVEPLGMLPNLKDISIDYNSILDLSPLANIGGLQILWVDDNQLSDLSPLSSLYLLWLSAGDNKITDISALSNSHNMERLWLGGNQIVDISPLSNLTSMRKLHLAINDIEDISPLANLQSLSSLYLGYNKVRSIEPLKDLNGLNVLSSGLDYEESPLEMQRWFLQGNPIEASTCPKENAPPAVALFCAQYN